MLKAKEMFDISQKVVGLKDSELCTAKKGQKGGGMSLPSMPSMPKMPAFGGAK
jgi:hypothetical protein